jgi:hypothetical protein
MSLRPIITSTTNNPKPAKTTTQKGKQITITSYVIFFE